jgi:hypothetical protein
VLAFAATQKASEAPYCNAASSGAPELAFICNAESSESSLLQRNKLRSSGAYFCYNGAFAATELAAVLQQAPSS